MDAPSEAEEGLRASHDVRTVLLVLRRAGPLSLEDLADRLGMGRIAVLKALRDLDGDGRITRYSERHGVGRPRHLYDAAPGGRGTVPGAYLGPATTLLEAAREVGGHVLLAKMFEARARTLARGYRERLVRTGAAAGSLPDRARLLAAALDEEGYASDVVADRDGVLLRQFNCPIFDLVERSQAACEAEASMIAEVLGASVSRESHIGAGARCCAFRLEARVWDAAQMLSTPASGTPRQAVATAGWSGVQMRSAAPRDDSDRPPEPRPGRTGAWTSRQMSWPRDRMLEEAGTRRRAPGGRPAESGLDGR